MPGVPTAFAAEKARLSFAAARNQVVTNSQIGELFGAALSESQQRRRAVGRGVGPQPEVEGRPPPRRRRRQPPLAASRRRAAAAVLLCFWDCERGCSDAGVRGLADGRRHARRQEGRQRVRGREDEGGLLKKPATRSLNSTLITHEP